MRLLLERRGFAVVEASDTSGALVAALATPAPDLVVLDEVLDGIASGAEIAPVIAARRPGTKMLMVAAYRATGTKLAGVDALIGKTDIQLLGYLADELVSAGIARHG